MLRRFLSILIISVTSVVTFAQDSEVRHWQGIMSFGLNNDGYEFEIGCSWWPVKSFGLRLAIGLAGEIEEVEDWDWLNDDYYEDRYDYASRFKFMASLELKSPAVLKTDNFSFHLFATPGLGYSPGASGSRDAQTTFWQLRGGIEMDIEDVVVQLGYGYSDFNLYSGDPYCHHGHSDNPNRKTHSGFITIGYRF